MKKLFILIFYLISLLIYSQEFRIPFRSKNLWGFADKTGKIKVTPKYDSVSISNDNLRWFVYKNNKTGVIDSSGNEKLATEYDSIERKPLHSRDNDFYLFKNKKTGYADIGGKIIFPCDYKEIVACNEILIGKISNFFIQRENGSFWELQGYNHDIQINQIQEFENFYEGNYSIKKNNKWGFYNVSLKKWIFNAEYDEIGSLHYKDFYEKKKEYSDYRYFAKKGDTYYLCTEDFKIAEFKNKYDDFFEDKRSAAKTYSTVFRDSGEPEKKSFTQNNSDFSKVYRLSSYSGGPGQIKILHEKNKFGLQIADPYEEKKILPKYDEIQLIAEGGSHRNEVAFFRKKDKWGIFDLKKFVWVTEVAYNDIILSKIRNILLVKDKKNIGLFEINDGRTDFDTQFIPPIYEKFSTIQYARSLDDNYKSFHVYFFIKNGKIYPVGMNGVQFYQD
ncbi:hypothetical protein HNP38_002888 [Chryseobacterium defluvii]|uniref:WG repeat protein n=1 Tax=Chryseobacterium defluvii TaxID=160396 RepID=A0A840KL38_9FLAO|nr:WG repeat-containing protein [Chryseobacterium defluvii]MBB4807582.1 hypothetical protein [Chryseobacterium defluvii]